VCALSRELYRTVITSVIRLVTLFPFLQAYDKTYQIAWTDLWMYVYLPKHPSKPSTSPSTPI
jgi:hypothetical protein